jgi:hypothetical protein
MSKRTKTVNGSVGDGGGGNGGGGGGGGTGGDNAMWICNRGGESDAATAGSTRAGTLADSDEENAPVGNPGDQEEDWPPDHDQEEEEEDRDVQIDPPINDCWRVDAQPAVPPKATTNLIRECIQRLVKDAPRRFPSRRWSSQLRDTIKLQGPGISHLFESGDLSTLVARCSAAQNKCVFTRLAKMVTEMQLAFKVDRRVLISQHGLAAY